MRRLALLGATAAILGACRGPAGPALGGTISGYVHVFNEYGQPLASDSGVFIVMLPTANTFTTDVNGAYTFPGSSTGIYSPQYLGTGIGTYTLQEQGFYGGGTLYLPVINLGMASTGVITNFAVTPNAAGDTLLATGTITAPPSGVSRYVRLFYSLANSVGSNVTLYTVTGPVFGHPYAVSSASFTIVVTGQDLQALRNNFPAGSTVNVIAYGESYYENSYTDGATGRLVYPNVCSVSSNLATFTLP